MELVNAGCSLVLTTGGTGPALRDVTPEATLAVADKEMPGFGEQMRQISLKFVPTAILSRQVAVIREQSLIINLPGQPKAIARDAGRPERRRGPAGGARHLCGRAVLRGPDRRALPGNARRGLQGVSPSLGTAPGTRRLECALPSRIAVVDSLTRRCCHEQVSAAVLLQVKPRGPGAPHRHGFGLHMGG